MNRLLKRLGLERKELRAWASYDWANSAFVTSIMGALLPIYYVSVSGSSLGQGKGTAYWGYTQTVALIIIALSAPVLGAAADFLGAKKKFLAVFAGIGATGSMLLFFATEGNWLFASAAFIIGNIGYASGNIFYESLLPHVARPEEIDRVSTAGYAVGYVGGGLLLALQLAWTMSPETFGFADAAEATRWAFLSVALWWVVFTLPILRGVAEPPRRLESDESREMNAIGAGLTRVLETFSEIRQYRHLFVFLLAFWFYNDGINTIIKMATAYGTEIGIGSSHLNRGLFARSIRRHPRNFRLWNHRRAHRSQKRYLSRTRGLYRDFDLRIFHDLSVAFLGAGLRARSRSRRQPSFEPISFRHPRAGVEIISVLRLLQRQRQVRKHHRPLGICRRRGLDRRRTARHLVARFFLRRRNDPLVPSRYRGRTCSGRARRSAFMRISSAEDLSARLRRIDGRGYKAYKSLKGAYAFERCTLFIDHVQGDPYAAASKIRLRAAQDVGSHPLDLFDNPVKRIAYQDFIARAVRDAIPQEPRRGTGKSGLITIDAGGQEVIERSALVMTEGWVEARVEVGLPADGRRILGREAERLLREVLPMIVDRALLWPALDRSRARSFVHTVENYHGLSRALAENKLVGFVADASVLPRASGNSDLPMQGAVPFCSPPGVRIRLPLLHPLENGDREIQGMGLSEGVTLIVGGGYHGKSTLLKAIERGVYPHIPGDGREYVVCRPDAVKIRSEESRSVANVDISPFIQHLPLGRSTSEFSTDDASGSTSQAASIVEALELRAKLLLLDEDSSATNFMMRDARMQALVASEQEPILPFLDRVRELADDNGVSTVLVMGGSGDYFEPADRVIKMMEYRPEDVTEAAHEIAACQPSGRARESLEPLGPTHGRHPVPSSVDPSNGSRPIKIEARGKDQILFGREIIELSGLDQLVDTSQTRAIGFAIALAMNRFGAQARSVDDIMRALERLFDESGLDVLAPFGAPGEHPGNFARPRRFEIAGGLNRLRSVRMETL